jgi:hypothetical protein
VDLMMPNSPAVPRTTATAYPEMGTQYDGMIAEMRMV